MELFLCRHAQPQWVKDDLCIDNPPLTDLGRRQAALLGARLSRERF
ncbi:MAG: histidine phosphatase family protein, partial [Acidimicrobiaceae bacterium]